MTIFETERLIVRNWIPEQDAQQAFEIYRDPEVTYFLKTRETSVESQRQSLTRIVERYKQLNNGTGFWQLSKNKPQQLWELSFLNSYPITLKIMK
jgi:RimJ/RimL family protein N-acetyltransferase